MTGPCCSRAVCRDKLLLRLTASVPQDSRHCLMLLASPLTCGLLQRAQSCLTGQADICCSSAAQGKLLQWPVAELTTPSCTCAACSHGAGQPSHCISSAAGFPLMCSWRSLFKRGVCGCSGYPGGQQRGHCQVWAEGQGAQAAAPLSRPPVGAGGQEHSGRELHNWQDLPSAGVGAEACSTLRSRQ